MKLFTLALVVASTALPADALYNCGAGEYRQSSSSTCAELQSGRSASFFTTVSSVCYFGATDDVTCPVAMEREAAGDYCNDAGATVCSLEQVLTGNLNGLGCPITTQDIWTRTPCGNDGEFWVTPADGSGTPQCIKPETGIEYKPRCCGDDVVKVCEQCPLNAFSIGPKSDDFTEYGLSECVCAPGYTATFPTSGNTREFTCSFDSEPADFTCGENQYGVRSAKSCQEELFGKGYKRNRQYCAATRNAFPGVGCPSFNDRYKTFERASMYCTAKGGRLCDITEAERGAAGNTGCNFDTRQMWTSTPCGTGGYWVTGGSFAHNRLLGGARCLDATETNAVPRCCANLSAPRMCFECPPGSTSPAGSFGAESCVCTDGVAALGGCVTDAPTKVPTGAPTPEPTCPTNQYKGKSKLNCRQLDLDRAPASRDVCALSQRNGRCFRRGGQTLAESEATCAAAGARLCSATELENGEARGSGCDLDEAWIWTATPCCDMTDETTCANTPLSRYVVRGHGYGPPTCVEESQTGGGTRCCADRNVENPCLWCPRNTGNTGTKGGVRTCTCQVSPFFGPGGSECKELTAAPTTSPTNSISNSCPANTFASGSQRHCLFHGWEMLRNNSPINDAGRRTCGDTKIGGRCFPGRMPYSAAKTFCTDAGARLCMNSHEVNTIRHTTDSCGTFRSDRPGVIRFWTERPCDETGGVWTTNGISTSNDQCVDPANTDNQHFLACCADEVIKATGESTYCKSCPGRSESPIGSTDYQDCRCQQYGSKQYGYGKAWHSDDDVMCRLVTSPPTMAPVPTFYPSQYPTTATPSVVPTLMPTDSPTDLECLGLPENWCRPAALCEWVNRACRLRPT